MARCIEIALERRSRTTAQRPLALVVADPQGARISGSLIVESAVDALSALLLLAPTLPPNTLVASTAGVAATLPRWLQAFHAPRILCAFDADRAGDQAALALRRHTPNCNRLRPVGANDWNDLLRRSRRCLTTIILAAVLPHFRMLPTVLTIMLPPLQGG